MRFFNYAIIVLCLFCFSTVFAEESSSEIISTLDLLVDDENISHTNQNEQNLLHLAVWSKDMAVIRYIADRAPSLITGRDEDGDTPFLYSCIIGDMEIMEFLLSTKQVDINESNNKKNTCLHFLADNLHLSLIPTMVEKGADPSLQDVGGELPSHILLMNLQKRGMFNFLAPEPERVESVLNSLERA